MVQCSSGSNISSCKKRMKYIRDRLTTDRASASSMQPPRAINACTLVTARDEGRVNGLVHADAAQNIDFFARPFPLPLHVLLESNEKFAGLLQGSSPFCIIKIVLNDCVEELAAVFPDLHNASMFILDELGKSLKVSRKCLAFCELTHNPCAIPWVGYRNLMIQPPSVFAAAQHTFEPDIRFASRQIPR